MSNLFNRKQRQAKRDERKALEDEIESQTPSWHIQQLVDIRRGSAQHDKELQESEIARLNKAIARDQQLVARLKAAGDPEGYASDLEGAIREARRDREIAQGRLAQAVPDLNDQHYLLTGERS